MTHLRMRLMVLEFLKYWSPRWRKKLAKTYIDELGWFEFQGVMIHAAYKMKDTQLDLLESLLNIFYMFSIRIWGNYTDETDAIGIKSNKCKKGIGYTIQNITFNLFNTIFVVNTVFEDFWLAWIAEKMRTSTLMLNKCVLLGWVMVHGIIHKYTRTCMDIHLKNSSGLEEKTDIILSVILTHMTRSIL